MGCDLHCIYFDPETLEFIGKIDWVLMLMQCCYSYYTSPVRPV